MLRYPICLVDQVNLKSFSVSSRELGREMLRAIDLSSLTCRFETWPKD